MRLSSSTSAIAAAVLTLGAMMSSGQGSTATAAWLRSASAPRAPPGAGGSRTPWEPPRRLEGRGRPCQAPKTGGSAAGSAGAVASAAAPVVACWDREELLQYAAAQGVELSLTELGPAFRGVARSTANRTEILGYVEGLTRAGKLLHLDKMEVFRHVVKRVRRDNPDFTGGGNPLGVGLLVAYLCVWHAQERRGCRTAEFLAIDDSEVQHRRLVKLYRQAGFDSVKYVGDDWRDVPDRLVWGGCGTLLRQDVPTLLRFWTGLLEKGKQKAADRAQR